MDAAWNLADAAIVTLSLETIQKGIEHSNSIDPSLMNPAIRYLSEPSMYGELQFDENGVKVFSSDDIIFSQYIGSTISSQTIRRILPITVGLTPIYPMPTFNERIYIQGSGLYSNSIERIVAFINGFALLIILFTLLITILGRNHPIIAISSPLFLSLFCLGAILLLISTYFATITQTPILCATSVWLLTIGFNLMFSSLFVKTLRIYYIFSRSKLRRIKISNLKLSLLLLGFVSIDIILNIIWSSTGKNIEYRI